MVSSTTKIKTVTDMEKLWVVSFTPEYSEQGDEFENFKLKL